MKKVNAKNVKLAVVSEKNECPEIWFPVKGFEGRYEVSTHGRIKSLANDKSRKEKILKPQRLVSGYLYVNIGGKFQPVHRIVAESLLNNPTNRSQIHHKDEDKSNNNVHNLLFVSAAENCNLGVRNEKISRARTGKPRPELHKAVVEFDPDTLDILCRWDSISECSVCTGIPQGTISRKVKLVTPYKGRYFMEESYYMELLHYND